MPNLNTTIESLAAAFANQIVQAIRSASLEEILGQGTPAKRAKASNGTAAPKAPKATRKKGRLGRRSAEDITTQLGTIVALLKKNAKGLKSEQIKETLKLDRREIPRLLSEGLKTKALRKTGEKRATVYRAN